MSPTPVPVFSPPPLPGRAETDFIIETDRLAKTYGTQRALADVTVRVPSGTIGLLGPNGAGKSTFIKCLLNLETPTAGTARVLGRDTRAEPRASRERIGYSPERDCHIAGLAGCEYVAYCGQLSGMPMRLARQRTHEILDLVGMGQERYRPVDTYSTGMKQRVKLAQALVHDPQVVFLDEPTNGLDPSGREHILKLIGSLRRDLGISVVMCSHLLRDIERVCDRVIIIGHGRLLEHDTIANLKNRHRRVVEIAPAGERERFVAALAATGVQVATLPNGRLRVESASDSIEWILQLMRAQRLPPAEIVANPDALHELFLKSIADNQEASDGDAPPPARGLDRGEGAAAPIAARNHDHGSQPQS
ncbi:MAG: ABC transporter ATP-binding protein [Opitutaceae bacterium]|nr:ABC transporter ATP-binding protein [Opitutaceae bacterium]